VLPLSRAYIATKLDTLSYHTRKLTPLEQEELIFYRKDYTLENNILQQVDLETPYKGVLKTREGDRFRLGAYQDKQFALNLQPVFGYQMDNIDGQTVSRSWKGGWAYGYIGKNIGFSVDFRDNSIKNIFTGYDYARVFSPETGVIGVKSDATTFDFNEFNATISGSWKWGSITVGKNSMPIGYGIGGKIIVSDKAPSFPQIRLDINPAKWITFSYAHIWLNSNVIDSTTLYATSSPFQKQYQFREKLMATHSVTYKPFKGASFTFGESSIYSDGVKMAYLIPIVPFSALNHYLGEVGSGGNPGTNGIANSQVFFQLSSRNHIPKTHVYFSFFIDELRLKGGFDSTGAARNHTAYQIGASIADFPFNNLHLTLEYSKIQPFAYVHFIPAQTYQNSGYNLGHWIGPNADQLFMQLHYRIIRGLDFKMSYEFIQKGAVGTGLQQTSNQDIFPFLWGKVKAYSNFQMQVQYEYLHDLFVRFAYKNQYISGTRPFQNQDTLSFGLNYGF
jgi:hypothetical protein